MQDVVVAADKVITPLASVFDAEPPWERVSAEVGRLRFSTRIELLEADATVELVLTIDVDFDDDFVTVVNDVEVGSEDFDTDPDNNTDRVVRSLGEEPGPVIGVDLG